MQAIILCAGRGKRLRPYTKHKPKPLLNVCGKTILERILDSLKHVGIKEVIIVVGYKHEKIIEKIGSDYKGMKIFYAKQHRHAAPLAHSIKEGLKHVKTRFFVILGDTLVRTSLLKRMKKQRADVILPIFKHPEHEEGYYGIVVKNGKIVDVSHEFSSEQGEEIYDSPGIFLCSRKIAKYIEKSIEEGLEHRLDFLKKIKNRAKIKLLRISEKELIEIDTRKDLRRAKEWLSK